MLQVVPNIERKIEGKGNGDRIKQKDLPGRVADTFNRSTSGNNFFGDELRDLKRSEHSRRNQ